MDFTEHPERQGGGSENEKFYSMMSPIQITESAFNQFVNLTHDIDAKLYLNRSEDQSNHSTQSKDHKLFPQLQHPQPVYPNPKSSRHSHYASLEKRNSHSSDGKEVKNSPSKISLLQNSLRASNSGEEDIVANNETEITKGQIPPKIYNPSLENTQMSDKFALVPPSLSASTIKQPQSSEKNKKINKAFRIQRPDEVYDELEQQKKKNIEDEKGKVEKAKKIVDDNINIKKNMLSENNKAVINLGLTTSAAKNAGKFQQNINSNVKQQQLKNVQKFTSSCLFKLPSSTLVPKQIIHSSDINNDFYHKYSFELTKNQLIINSLYTIPFTHITKIKIIYNEYNRPEIKITYSLNGPQLDTRDSKVSHKSDVSFRESKKDFDGQSAEQLVAFICECYELIYAIFSWIILYKLVAMMAGKFDHLVTKEAKSPTKKEDNAKVNLNMNFNYSIEGIIFKKSKYLKNWDKRFVRIQNFILKSYRSPPNSRQQNIKGKERLKEEDATGQCTFELSNIKELWTRFQILQDKYLIVKIFRKNKLQKFELAVNSMNFCDFSAKENWLFGLVGMLKGEV